ncbi:hypothetical protein PO878_14395 [Iamia majanohamensis]|uniref:SalK n=1 Tax=Iamia majanohamensis TaxID=467976 RepID=A0AAF0BQZ8_9ACTN|nr:hypothetical protein [Iamia majanohamensis]WCO65691.1 hypothetical protein PO878_14395 [Iamia majanohamensis]
MVDASTARHLYERLEPLHAFIYFSPEANLSYAALGIEGHAGYFASRAAAMGAVGSEVVLATFFNFQPALVRSALPAAWEAASPAQVLEARLDGADKGLRRMLGDLVDDPRLPEAADLARQAAEQCRPEGRPLFAAHAGLPWPEEPHLVLFHAITLLREHRGDGHVAALTLENLDNGEVLVTHAASESMGLPESILQLTRGFSDDEWAAVKDRLRTRGILDADGALTAEGKELRQRIEDRTDAAALPPWACLGDERCTRLLEVAAPFSRAVVKSGVFGGAGAATFGDDAG